MEKKEEEPVKKCFCSRCFFPIEPADRVDIEGQSFHKLCCTCCICRSIPTSVKMFYGHVFCDECFKNYVQSCFKGESPCMHSNWWMQFTPGAKDQTSNEIKEPGTEDTEKVPEIPTEAPQKRCICARCLQAVDDKNKIDISGQSFHVHCAKCYFCHCTPTSNPKIYYGQVFCEDCFQKYVLNQSQNDPQEFKRCFEQWKNSNQVAGNMQHFLGASKQHMPCVYSDGQQPSYCRCCSGPQELPHNLEAKKSATQATVSNGAEDSCGTWDLSFEHRTEVSDIQESCNETEETDTLSNLNLFAAEKIEKLTKYLHEIPNEEAKKCAKKWKNYEIDKISLGSELEQFCGWTDLQDPKSRRVHLDCPKCLWQCGSIYVNSEYLQKKLLCGNVLVE